MKDTRWLEGMHQTDTLAALDGGNGEKVYTLYLKDFLSMPAVDFSNVTRDDHAVRSLLN